MTILGGFKPIFWSRPIFLFLLSLRGLASYLVAANFFEPISICHDQFFVFLA